MKKSPLAVACCIAVACLYAACGGSSGQDAQDGDTMTTDTTGVFDTTVDVTADSVSDVPRDTAVDSDGWTIDIADIVDATDAPDTTVRPWPTCAGIESPKTLAEKAAYFDEIAVSRHLAGDGLLRNLLLDESLESVELWYHVENVILWSGMYLASQAFKYEVTGDQTAQDNAKTVVAALHLLTQVTGVSGLYGRSMYKPGVSYNPVAADSTGWTYSTAEGFEGWRFRNDVSKDGYAGLMFGYAAALEHFDDAQLLSDIRDRLREIIDHIVGNHLQIVDTNGQVTEHGRLFQTAMDDFPGFNALMISSWTKVAQTALDDLDLDDLYYGCFMQMRDGVDCSMLNEISDMEMGLGSYINSMEQFMSLFMPNCKQNYDNFDMMYQAMYPLIRREQDPTLRERLLWVIRNNMFHTDDPKAQSIDPLGNSLFTFLYAAMTDDGPGDTMLFNAVDKSICTMKEFPEEKFVRHIPAGEQDIACYTRLDNPAAAEPIPLAEYPFDNYLWRLDFFEMNPTEIPENKRHVYSPEDYLVAYWLGRMHGIIPADL